MEANSITALEDRDGAVKSTQEEVESICFNFYSHLYEAREERPEQREAASLAFEGNRSQLTEDAKKTLKSEVSLEELSKALFAMAKDKAPGPDGIIVEFYQCLWPYMGPDFVCMIHRAIQHGQFPQKVTEGLIALISQEWQSSIPK